MNSPIPESNPIVYNPCGYDTKCYQALLDDNGRPLFDADLLWGIRMDPDAYAELLWPWSVDDDDFVAGPDKWRALSRQWDRWKDFREWQLHGRRRKPGFEEYLGTYKRDLLMTAKGRESVASPSFEEDARKRWEREYHDCGEAEEDVERHTEDVRSWLPQGFVPRRPLKLLPDPKAQDQWTTFVEYLAFEEFTLFPLARTAREQEEAREWGYEKHKAIADQQQGRVDWVVV
ncbi:hypothetical protein GGTG_04630 [Gaeumannomyces tritici R3-111a-1]|uniref:Uncharacterized protein n=1 Tax=Gaeumannomyces tritici (strain R3-111a-1) TaxID=644352 RepID=J3NTN0_GAET3|nr:hypothetical protein GGTG_04630 [Gaeumannomyces tritici R3-111a-1]EJT79545.1 hypothetical protein GGTG_04630 [Gaeumannomyces tritici R3-111a-1]